MTSSSDDSSPRKSGECQRFFGYGKRIPRDVKRHCGMCRQHAFVVETRGHVCPFKNCECEKCKLVRQRRSIMSTQIRLRREQDKRFQRTTNASEADVIPLNTVFEADKRDDINMCYFCQKCKNHGMLMWKKDHKRNCEYANCRCEQCDLIDTRRALDRHIKRNKDLKTVMSSDYSCSSSSEESSSSCDALSAAPSFQTLSVSLPSSLETTPALSLSDMPLLKPAVDHNPLLLPTLPSPFLATPSPIPTLPLASIFYGGLLPNPPHNFLVSNILNALSPFEIQLLLANMRSCSDINACSNY
ncbi:DM DNA binding domain protein [Ancylostoma caninum]|uniref:DM DNA binding domain protein n=1 Tax=Ancylostoma caninum TaxID=29170 RepID=A0A368H1L9_ANCCA|nr:DM DNA binding domain protein [Ancylostoma caninum]